MQLVPCLCSLTANATLYQAVQSMNLAQVDYVVVTPVVESTVGVESCLGILSSAQILQLTLTEPDWPQLPLNRIVTQMYLPLSQQELADWTRLQARFQQTQLSALPVLDSQGQMLGMLSCTQAWQAHQGQVLTDHALQIQALQDALATLAASSLETKTLLETQLQNHEQHLHQYQNRLESVLNSLEDVVWSVLPDSLQLLYINAATQKVFGRPIADFLRQLDLWFTMVYPEDRLLVEQAYQGLASLGQSDLEYRILWPNQELRWVRSRLYLIRDAQGQPSRIDGITSDVTTRRMIYEQLQFNALHDSLTGLANRSLLSDRIQQFLNRNRRHPEKFLAVLFLDVDRFKVINDSLGHHVGDQLLIQVAQRLRTCQRSGDTVARLGGDEFVLLLEDLEQREDALRVAQRVHDILGAPLQIDGHDIFMSVSIGIAFSNGEWTPLAPVTAVTHDPAVSDSGMAPMISEVVNALLRDADTAMYRAKAVGNGQHQVFDQSMHTEALRQLSIETELRRLLAGHSEAAASAGLPPETSNMGELLVYYQPIINLETFAVEGFEALVRWQHPQKGLVPPAEFIPIAEETGLIVQLDRWVIATAYRQLHVWLQQFPDFHKLSMSVNLSSRHFEAPGLINFFDRMLQELALDPSLFKLEITETTVVKNPRAAAQVLEQLQTRGIQICLDDFGTGYASLSYLQSLPFHVLKIDRSFIDPLGNHPLPADLAQNLNSADNSANSEFPDLSFLALQNEAKAAGRHRDQHAITKAIINLGKNLGLGIVAEGIEAWDQVNQLKSLNCPHGQGYLFARPMGCDDATRFLVGASSTANVNAANSGSSVS
jgi:diguanylate cyclase (GGDEF)-like protein